MCYIFFLFLTWFTLKRIFWTVVLFSLGKKYERKCFTYLIVFLLTKFIIRDIVIHLMFLYRVLKWDSAHHRKCIAPISHLGLCPQIYVWEGTGNRKTPNRNWTHSAPPCSISNLGQVWSGMSNGETSNRMKNLYTFFLFQER